MCFTGNFVKILRTPIFAEHLRATATAGITYFD